MELISAVAVLIASLAVPLFLLLGQVTWTKVGITASLVYSISAAFLGFESANHQVIDDGGPFRAACYVWIAILIVVRLVLWHKFKFSSPRAFKLLSLLFLFPVLFVIDSGVEISNRKLDGSSKQVHRQVILGKDFGRNSFAPGRYFFWVEWWNRPGRQIMISHVDKTTYDRAVPRRSVLEVSSHPGALGFEWIESFSLEE